MPTGTALVGERQTLGNMTLDELADYAAGVDLGARENQVVLAEFNRRQTLATETTGKFTRRMACYMFLSVIALAVGVIAQVVIAWVGM